MLLCFAIFYGCKTQKEAKEDLRFKVKTGDVFKIQVKSNPTTGYQWQLAEPIDSAIVKLDKKEFLSDESSGKMMVGGGGSEIWVFKGIKKGKTEIKLKYIRDWQKDSLAKVLKYNVNVR
jgi:inhibitor of cysteine peptidase